MTKTMRLLVGTSAAAALMVTAIYVIVLGAFSVRTEAHSPADPAPEQSAEP
jgi:hypothetical protein